MKASMLLQLAVVMTVKRGQLTVNQRMETNQKASVKLKHMAQVWLY